MTGVSIILITIIERSKSRGGDITPNICIVESDFECVSDGDSPKLVTRPFLLLEWSEHLRTVTSVWLGPAAAACKSDSAPAGV